MKQEKEGEWTLQVIECQAAETRFHNVQPLTLPKGNTSYLCLRKVKFGMTVNEGRLEGTWNTR